MLKRGSYLPGPHELYTDFWPVKGRRERDDPPGVESRVGPAVEPVADARQEGIVHGRVAQGAGDADPDQGVAAADGLDRAHDADHRVELEQRHGRRRVGQADRAVLDALHDLRGKRLGVDLEPTASAVVGSTAAWMTSCMRSVSVQNVSSPKVSKRKMSFPWAAKAGSGGSGPAGPFSLQATISAATLHPTNVRHLPHGVG